MRFRILSFLFSSGAGGAGGGRERCCTVHVHKKMVRRELHKIFSGERTLGPVTKLDPSGGRAQLMAKFVA